VDRVVVLRFQDNQIANTPVFRIGDPLTLFDFLAVRTENTPFEFRGPSLATYMVQETKKEDASRPWRKVVAEVGPDTIQAYWRNPDGSMQPIRAGGIRAEIIHKDEAGVHIPLLRGTYPGIDFTGLEHSPRGGVGLYLRDSRVFFKNVVLEPLTPNPHGDH
jgi:hypothetical protein